MTNDRRLTSASLAIGISILAIMNIFTPLRGQESDSTLLPIRTLRVSIHVFQDGAGQGNFCRDSADQVSFLYQLVEWVNHRLANLDTLKPAVSSPYVEDIRVRIRLDTLFYHRDSMAWDCAAEINSPYMRDRYVDSDTTLDYQEKYQTLPVFIGANNTIAGGHSRNIGDRGYIAVRGYYESFSLRTLPQAIDECGRNLVHELGHCLGLDHNFTGGPGGDQCDKCADNGCPVEGTSNNIMDYWPSYGYGLSQCQFDLIQFFLNGGQGNISEVVINDSCYRVSGAGYEVSEGDTLLIGGPVYLHNDLIVKSGGVLRVTGYLSMPAESRIELEAGARLEIDGGIIGNLCGDLWSGIRVSKGASGAEPAVISVKREGIVANARTGLLAAGPVETELENAVFVNCVESLVFLPASSDSVLIKNCRFYFATRLNHYEEGIMPGFFVRSEGIPRLEITGCKFMNIPGTVAFDADWLGTGILASGPSIRIEQSKFINLTCGVDLKSNIRESKAEVSDNQFDNNRYGIQTHFAGVQWISNNQFMLQRIDSGGTAGVIMWNPDRFVVNDNRFESVFGGGRMAGVLLNHPSSASSPVFKNTFLNLPVAVFVNGTPKIEPVLFQWAKNPKTANFLRLGPQLRYSEFEGVPMPMAIVTDSVYGTAVGTIAEAGPEYFKGSSRWIPGGFGWHTDSLRMVAFGGWKQETLKEPDHGLYWFMNYLGAVGREYHGRSPLGDTELMKYLLKIQAVEELDSLFSDTNNNKAISRIAEVPATARSSRLAKCWEIDSLQDQALLRDTLAYIAGKFVRADSLLTDLGTDLAQKNFEQWIKFQPGISHHEIVPTESFPLSIIEFPPLPASLMDGLSQADSRLPAFKLYPNPAQDFIWLQPQPGYSSNKTWDGNILSADGRCWMNFRIGSLEGQKLFISSLPPGVYFIELFSGLNKLGTSKFVKTSQR